MNLLALNNNFARLLLLTFTAVTSAAFAAGTPAAFEASYHIEKYGATVATMHLSLQHRDGKLLYRSHTRPKGMFKAFSDDQAFEQSTLRWSEKLQTLQLLDYQYSRAEKLEDNQQFSITWQDDGNASCQGTARQQTFSLPLSRPTWDRLSVQLALMMDLLNESQPRMQYRYDVIDNGEVGAYLFQSEGEHALDIGGRHYRAVKFKREHASGRRTTHLWLAPELAYIPLRVEQYKKGKLHLSMELAEPVKVTP